MYGPFHYMGETSASLLGQIYIKFIASEFVWFFGFDFVFKALNIPEMFNAC